MGSVARPPERGPGIPGLPARHMVVGVVLLLVTSSLLAVSSPGVTSAASVSGLRAVSVAPIPPTAALTAAATGTYPTSITHVIMIIEENQEWSEVWNYGPYQVSLANEYANLSQFYALHQSSYSAYAAQTSGYDTTDAPKPINVTSIASLVTAAGETWKEWVESAPSACDRSAATPYSTKHVPFVWYNDIYDNSTECNADVIPMSLAQMQSDLSTGTNIPNFLLITPNQYDDGDAYHSACGGGAANVTQAEEVCTDTWLSELLPSLFSDTSLFEHTAVLISYDQTSTSDDSGSQVGADGGHVFAAIVSDYSKGRSTSTAYTAYNMLTTSEWLLGLSGGNLENDNWNTRPPIESAFSSSGKTYAVTFAEKGLPVETGWTVTLGGNPQSTGGSTITFDEGNGTYDYKVSPVSGYSVAPASGSVTVKGKTVNVKVTFTPDTYPVTFTESGLPSGTEWWVNATGGGSSHSTTTTLSLSEPNGTYEYSVATTDRAYAAPGGSFTVAGVAVPESVEFSLVTYAVTFTEEGLPAGTQWWVNLTGGSSTNSTTTTLSFSEPNGTYEYSVAASNKDFNSSTGTFTVHGAPLPVSVRFTESTFLVTFTETGLPFGAEWWVNVTGGASTNSTTTTLSFSEPNGTYEYTAATTVKEYSALLSSDTFSVNGNAVSETASFTMVTYPITFDETGLPSGTTWSVALGGSHLNSTSSTLTFHEANGTYPFTIANVGGWHETGLPYSGTLEVFGGAIQAPTLAFWQVTYDVAFSESGLPPGSAWWVNLTTGSSFSSRTSALSFNQPNGTYAYTIATSDKEYSSTGGSFTAQGSVVATTVSFALVRFAVAFTETGLRSGTNWTVTVDGTVFTSPTSTIPITEPNGTYSFTVGAVPGYSVNRSAGSITVSGSAVDQSLIFQSNGGLGWFFGLPALEAYLVLGGIATAVVLWVAFAVVWARSRAKPSRGSPSRPPPPGARQPPP
jgi:hypothetical protein